MGWEAEYVESTCPEPVRSAERHQQTLSKHDVSGLCIVRYFKQEARSNINQTLIYRERVVLASI